MGFFFSWAVSSIRRDKKKQLDQLLTKFEGQKNDYERSVKKTEYLFKMKYRVRIAEKVYYMLTTCMAFVFYKSPSVTQMIIYDNAHLSIPFFALSVIAFNYGIWYLDKAHL